MFRRRIASLSSSVGLHVAAILLIDALAARVPPQRTAAPHKPVRIVTLPRTPAGPGLKPDEAGTDRSMIRPHGGSADVDIPGFKFNVARIRERATMLFPFLTPGLALERFGLQPQRDPTADVLTWEEATPRAPEPPQPSAPPLVVSEQAVQSFVDRAWSRRDRWDVFGGIAALASRYSADRGQLAEVLHKYTDQNALQPYVDTSIRDPRLWTELGIAADHVYFIAFVSQYVMQHPSTRASTELLFLLDRVAEGSLEVLLTLLQSEPNEQLEWTRRTNRGAYDLLLDLQRFYSAQLARHGLRSADEVRRYYDNVRLAILEAALRTAPDAYRASDARFLIGSIHWRRGDVDEAVKIWRAMAADDPTDSYAAAQRRILEIVTAPDGVDRREVETVLRGVHGAWLMFSIDRLARFGYRLDTY